VTTSGPSIATPPPLPATPAQRRALWLAVAAVVLAAGAVVLFVFNPEQAHFFPPCPLHAVTGLYCPGCGSTRALHQLLHGHVAAAFDFNPLLVVALPFVLVGLAREVWRITRGIARPSRLPAWWMWAVLVVVVAFGVARNLPWGPVRWMAPRGLSP
jgi:hypothetical protein